MTGLSKDLQEECNSVVLHDNMKISRLFVYNRRAVKEWDTRKSRYARRERSFDGGSSKNRLEIQDNPKFKKRVSNQVPYKFPRSSNIYINT